MSTITAHPSIFALPFLSCIVGIGLLLVWIAEKSPASRWLHSYAGVVAPHAGLLALLFGLFAAFLANDVSIHTDRARIAISREASAITVVLGIADGLADRGETLRQLAVDFGRKTTGAEWSSAQQTAEADRLGLKLLHEILFGGLAAADNQVRQVATAAITEMRAARNEMSAVAHSQTSSRKWNAVLILGILTQIGIVVVHFGKPRASALASVLFAVGMSFMLWVVLMRLDPFVGKDAVSLTPISDAYEHFVAR
jgi:hypothetical protein